MTAAEQQPPGRTPAPAAPRPAAAPSGRRPRIPGSGLAKGLAVTLRTMTKKTVTQQYPDALPELPPRSRGVIGLFEENCTVCMLCARECPDWCIYIDSHKETLPPAAPGGRERSRNVLDRFAIDFSLCMYCGICIEVCPFDALFWSPEFEYAETDIRELTHERDTLRAWMWTVPAPPALDPAAEDPKELVAARRTAEKLAARQEPSESPEAIRPAGEPARPAVADAPGEPRPDTPAGQGTREPSRRPGTRSGHGGDAVQPGTGSPSRPETQEGSPAAPGRPEAPGPSQAPGHAETPSGPETQERAETPSTPAARSTPGTRSAPEARSAPEMQSRPEAQGRAGNPAPSPEDPADPRSGARTQHPPTPESDA